MGYGHNPDPSAWADESLDEEFPLGDGTADTGALVSCPYCGESVEIVLDPGSGTRQEYVEDCEVCCRPWQVYEKIPISSTNILYFLTRNNG